MRRRWKSALAGAMAIAMTLSPIGGIGTVVAEEADGISETMTDMDTGTEEAEDTTPQKADENLTEDATETSEYESHETVSILTEETAAEEGEVPEDIEINTVGNLPLTAECFPDEAFRTWISTNVDKDKDGVLSQGERDAQTELYIPLLKIRNLEGIQYFEKLESLVCSNNDITSLDLSKNKNLKQLQCYTNPLINLNLEGCTKLEKVLCYATDMKDINIRGCTALSSLVVFDNKLESLDVSTCTNLTELSCWCNALKKLDVSKNSKLTSLECDENQLAKLDVSKCADLEALSCSGNKLIKLDISKNTKLKRLFCKKNQITKIDVSKNTKLEIINCSENQLEVLDIAKNTKLTNLYVSGNLLTKLDLSKNTQLKTVYCANNQLPYVNVEGTVVIKKGVNLGDGLEADSNVYPAKLNSKRQVNLAEIPGFQTSKVSELKGGKISGTILTFDKDVDKVTYSYNCGNGLTETFAIKDDAKMTSTEAFCNRLYTLCLGRKADPAGIKYWAEQLDNKTQSGAQVGYHFVFSEEYKKKNTSNEEYVKMLYQVFMNRQADKGGLNYWVGLLNDGMSREYVYKGFAESKEFTNICNSYGINRGTVTIRQARDRNVNLTRFLNRIYVKAMNRKGEEAGLNYWCEQIQYKRMTPTQVAESFIYSKEFTDKKLSNAEYVKVLYRTFMGREADQSGLNYWVGRLNRGESRKTILKSFAGCPEFKNIVKSFGL